MASKRVTTSEALRECLDSYNFQWGSRVNSQVIHRMKKLIAREQKRERETNVINNN